MKNPSEPRLMDFKQTALYLGITESALRKKRFLNQIGGMVRIGARIYFDRIKLDRFIDESEIPIKVARR